MTTTFVSFPHFKFFQYAALIRNLKKIQRGLKSIVKVKFQSTSDRELTILLATYFPILDFNLNNSMDDTG